MDTPFYTRFDRFKIRAMRAGRAIGLGWLRAQYFRVRGKIDIRTPDPLDSGRLLWTIVQSLPSDFPAHLELDEKSVEAYLDESVRQAPGYRLDGCFRRLLRDLDPLEYNSCWMTCSERRMTILFTSRDRRICLDVISSVDSEPRLSREQSLEFFGRLMKLRPVTPETVAAMKKELLDSI